MVVAACRFGRVPRFGGEAAKCVYESIPDTPCRYADKVWHLLQSPAPLRSRLVMAWRWMGCGCLALCVLVAVIGCQDEPAQPPSGKISVVVSIAPQAWLASQLGGQYVEVITLVEPGDSPETYQPTDAQVSRVMQARVYFRIGVPVERSRWCRVISDSKQFKIKIVDTHRGIPLRQMAGGGLDGVLIDGQGLDDHHGHAHHHHSGSDPHIWLSPSLLKLQASAMTKVFMDLEPKHIAYFADRFDALEKQLDEADRLIRELLEPWRGKAFLVFHPAWGYFADEYGLRQVAVQVQGKEPSDYQLTRLAGWTREAGVEVIFAGPQDSRRLTQAVARVIGGRVEVIDPMAWDVPTNLVRVADVLAASYR